MLLLLSVPTMSSAWNKPGHMVTAAIAYENLKQSDPEALAATSWTRACSETGRPDSTHSITPIRMLLVLLLVGRSAAANGLVSD